MKTKKEIEKKIEELTFKHSTQYDEIYKSITWAEIKMLLWVIK